MLDYLSAHFAPKPAALTSVATAGSEAIYKRACLTCHEDDLIESQRLSRAGWVREVDKMIRWGADVTADRQRRARRLSRRSVPAPVAWPCRQPTVGASPGRQVWQASRWD